MSGFDNRSWFLVKLFNVTLLYSYSFFVSLPSLASFWFKLRISFLLARSACLRYAGCEHFVSALGPSALGWEKVSRILQIYAFASFYTETTYQLITIGPRFYKNVIIFLFSENKKINYKLLTISYSESAYLITPGQPLKPRFYENYQFVYFLA